MNKKLAVILLSSFLATSCGTFPTGGSGDNTSEEINFSITKAEFTDNKGHMSVSYTCDKGNPFRLASHTFSKLNNFGNEVSELNYASSGVFTLKTSIISESVKFEFVDSKGVIYITARFSGVEQYDDSKPGVDYPEGYNTLYWSDEFDGTSLDTSKWTYEIGNGNGGWGNGESQYYTDHNDYVQDGVLHIAAKKETINNFNYTSTRIKTQNKVKFTYGYIEAKIALPLVTGMWPAFWMMPNDSVYGGWPHSGEIDIMEAKGRISYQSSSALHYSDSNGHTYKANEKNGHYIADYHKYAVEWQKETIKYYIDDVLHFSVNYYEWSTQGAMSSDYAPFDKDFYLILNLAVGGHFDNWQMPPESFSSAEMKVDYVRVFK